MNANHVLSHLSYKPILAQYCELALCHGDSFNFSSLGCDAGPYQRINLFDLYNIQTPKLELYLFLELILGLLNDFSYLIIKINYLITSYIVSGYCKQKDF